MKSWLALSKSHKITGKQPPIWGRAEAIPDIARAAASGSERGDGRPIHQVSAQHESVGRVANRA